MDTNEENTKTASVVRKELELMTIAKDGLNLKRKGKADHDVANMNEMFTFPIHFVK